jgi:RHS repeat-associated protein
VYQKAPGLPAQERERYLYGMDMIGVMQMDISGQPPELEQPCEECPPPPPPLSIGLGCNGQRMYYLKDQVGNVRVILLRGTTAGTPPLAFQNYYPFGMKQPGGLSSSFTQRFGYQGEYAEQDPETKLAAFEARMYDAVTGRWLAVDPQHQYHSPYLAMGNNPVMMVDPDGELVHLVVGAVIGGVVNWAVNGARFDEKGLAYFGIGALAGALSAGIGAGVNVAIAGGSFGAGFLGTATGVASTGFFAGAATGAATGFTNGLITGTGNSLMDKNSVPYSLEKGLTNGAIQGLVGGVVGGIGGGIDAYRKDLNFWNGTAELDLTQGIGAHGITTDKERIIGKYVGKFEGVDVYETPELGTGYGSGGITLPGRGITVGKGVYTKNLDFELMQHEFGHTLQIKQMGAARFLKEVGLPSLRSASKHGVNGWKHNEFWTEVSANRLSKAYFDSNYQYLSQPWNHIRFPLIYK